MTGSKRILRGPYHPFLFPLFPIFAVYANNAADVPAGQLAAPGAIALIAAAVLFAVLRMATGSVDRGGLILSVFWLLFFTIGPVLYGDWKQSVPGGPAVGVVAVVAIWLGLLSAASFVILRTKAELAPVTRALNRASIFLLAMPLALGAYRSLAPSGADSLSADSGAASAPGAPRDDLPDIYYIMLDGYAREDVLRELYDFDNSDFLNELRERGFYVASGARANYAQTHLAVASVLNLDYLQDIFPRHRIEDPSPYITTSMISNSEAARALRERGYRMIAFPTGYLPTDLKDADVYVDVSAGLSEFHAVLLSLTPLDAVGRAFRRELGVSHESHRRRALYTLDHLHDFALAEGPKFIFAHLICPHPPFVFGPRGEARKVDRAFELVDGSALIKSAEDRIAYIGAYRDQVRFINRKIVSAVENILRASPRPPVIVIHSDHGPGSKLDWDRPDRTDMKERMSILNAIYFPGGPSPKFYETMSPVNIFRFVFNEVFGADFPILEDKSFFSTPYANFEFHDVTDRTDRTDLTDQADSTDR